MNKKQARIILSITGVIICGLSVGLFKAALLGTDPFQCLMSGLNNVINLDFGTLYLIVNIVLLTLIFIFDKTFIGIATFINLFLLGYVVNFSYNTLTTYFPVISIEFRIFFLLIGFITLCFSSSLYISSNLGVSTYDAISLILSKKGIASFKVCRISSDLVCVIVGFILGATVGIGTILTAFLMGPLIEYFNNKFTIPFLNKFR